MATSTTVSSTSSPSPPEDAATAVIACGALGAHVRELARERGWSVEIHCLPPLLHNRPGQIAPAVEQLATSLLASGRRVAVAYADCGTYGALDALCERLGVERLAGLHCYDVLAGSERVRALLEEEPGTYVLTDFLVRSFRRTVVRELGLDRHPELRPDYFSHYRRVVWLAQRRSDELEAEARAVARFLDLPLEVLDTGLGGLERDLGQLVASRSVRPAGRHGGD